MKQEFNQYLLSIGMTDSLIQRVESLFKIASSFVKSPIEDIFVTDLIDGEGKRIYLNLWFFAGSIWMEAKNFLTVIDIDQAILEENIKYWRVQMADYTFESANEKSRLSIDVNTDQLIICQFKATKENCDSLKALFIKRIVTPFIARNSGA